MKILTLPSLGAAGLRFSLGEGLAIAHGVFAAAEPTSPLPLKDAFVDLGNQQLSSQGKEWKGPNLDPDPLIAPGPSLT